MRNRWEDAGKSDLDAPAALTERELRSLRRRSRAGIIAMFLALLSTGAVGYTVVAGVERIQDLREMLGLEREARAAEQPASPENARAATGAPALPDSAGTRAASSAQDSSATPAGS